MSRPRGRAARTVRAFVARLASLPRGARLAAAGIVVAAAFAGVVLPLFANGGAPHAEISGQLPDSAAVGKPVQVDIAVDNVGDSIISPVCVALHGPGVTLVSANFQGLDEVAASADRVCGGELTGQETISVTLVITASQRGHPSVTLVPERGSTVIGPNFTQTLTVT